MSGYDSAERDDEHARTEHTAGLRQSERAWQVGTPLRSVPGISPAAKLFLSGSRFPGGRNTALRAEAMRSAQSTHGNRAVQRLMAPAAEQAPAEEEEIGSRIERASGAGTSLDNGARAHLERSLGADLSGVRVHTGPEADKLSQEVSATAFTSGKDIFFRSGVYNPDSPEGMRLLAHEVSHTVQQSKGPVAGTPTEGGISLSDPTDEHEQAAEKAADAAVMGMPASVDPGASQHSPTPVQRMMGLPIGDDDFQLPSASDITGAVGGGIATLGGMAGDAVSGFGGFLGDATSAAGDFLGRGVGGAASSWGRGVSTVGNGIFGEGSVVGQMSDVIGGAAGQLGGIAGGAISGAANSLGDIERRGYGNIGGAIGSAASGVGEFVGGLGGMIPEDLGESVIM